MACLRFLRDELKLYQSLRDACSLRMFGKQKKVPAYIIVLRVDGLLALSTEAIMSMGAAASG
eukprot:6370823-Pyramimonas_sp.AAC.1